MKYLQNLTPHPIVLRTLSGDRIIPPSGLVARCAPAPATVNDEGLPVPVARSGALGPVTGVPDALTDTGYIVSALVLGHPSVAGRRDILAPGTGPQDGAIRDESGRIIAVTRLVGRAD